MKKSDAIGFVKTKPSFGEYPDTEKKASPLDSHSFLTSSSFTPWLKNLSSQMGQPQLRMPLTPPTND